MMLSIYLFLAVVVPLVLYGVLGPKLLLVKSIWIIAAAFSIITGVVFIGNGGVAAIVGLFFLVAGVVVMVVSIRSYFHVRIEEGREQSFP